MAIKAAFAAALLVALLALAGATTFTTTVTTATDEETNPFQRQCREQVQGRQFRACQRFLQQRGRSPYEFDVIERQGGYGQQGSEQECCQQLRQMDQQGCGCEAIRRALTQVQQRGTGQQGEQSYQVYQRAQQLPQRCNLRQQQCQFPVMFL